MPAQSDCLQLCDKILDCANHALSAEDRLQVEQHLKTCAKCRAAVNDLREVQGLLRSVLTVEPPDPELNRKAEQRLHAASTGPLPTVPALNEAGAEPVASDMLARMGSAPWWLISICLHVLLIILMGLITMAVRSDEDNTVIVVMNMERVATVRAVEEKTTKPDVRDILDSKHETPATDPNSEVSSDIVIPPDILAKAELGDHFETINPDRPDTHSAFGNPDAHMFHSESGNDEAAGGGGNGGTGLLGDMIGVGGPASIGTGGGWGGGNGTGTGVDNGAGHGSFGSRNGGGRRLMVMRHGGSKATESAVDVGLDWLKRHQEADGHWEVVKYGGGQSPGFGCAANASHEVGLTGLAMLAFLGAGHTPKVGKYKAQVSKAMEYLISKQRPDGSFNPPREQDYDRYDDALATLALCEAYGMGHDSYTGIAAQKGVDYLVSLQQPTGAWIHLNWSSTSLFGWVIMAMKSAKIAKLKVPPEVFQRGLDFLAKASEKDADGYWGKVKYDPFHDFEANKGITMTAVGMAAFHFLGQGVETAHQAEMLAKNTPRWDPAANWEQPPQNFYYWYYGTLGMFQTGGDGWRKWNEDLKKALLPNQCKGGPMDGTVNDKDGSWDPVTQFDCSAGRVYSTAMGVLCLEVYYRYLPLNR